jgi:hypothetical protein
MDVLKLFLIYVLSAQVGVLCLVLYLGLFRREPLPEGSSVGVLILGVLVLGVLLLGVLLAALGWVW